MSVFSRMYRGETQFDFVAVSKKTLIVSAVLIAASILTMIIRPFNLSIDFSGGVIVTVENNTDADVESIRVELRSVGYADARVQTTSDGFILVQTEELSPSEQDQRAQLLVLTAEGEAMLAELIPEARRFEDELLGAVNARQYRDLLLTMQTLERQLDQLPGNE